MGATRKVWKMPNGFFDDNLIVFATSVCIAWELAMEKEGNPKTKPTIMTCPLLAFSTMEFDPEDECGNT